MTDKEIAVEIEIMDMVDPEREDHWVRTLVAACQLGILLADARFCSGLELTRIVSETMAVIHTETRPQSQVIRERLEAKRRKHGIPLDGNPPPKK